MNTAIFLAASASIATVAGSATTSARARLTAIHPPRRPVPADHTDAGLSPLARQSVAGVAGLAAWLLAGGWFGLALGVGVGCAAAWWLGHLGTRAEREEQTSLERDLPPAADLLAACLLAGATIDHALAAVAAASGRPLATRLNAALALYRLGASPPACWDSLMQEPALAPLGRALLRASASGAPVADVVERLADDQRAARQATALEAARRVSVAASAPLGLCFLPAFIVVGIVPMAISMARSILPALQ